MQPIPVQVGDETILVPTLKVQQVIDLATLQHDRDRRLLLDDAKDAGLDPEAIVGLLREHRKEQGLSATIMRSAFTVEGAFRIIRCALDGNYSEEFENIDPNRLSNIALACLGVDLDELTESENESGTEKKD